MSEKLSFPISPETWSLIGGFKGWIASEKQAGRIKGTEFFDGLSKVGKQLLEAHKAGKAVPPELLQADGVIHAEGRTVTEILPSGDVQVTFSYPIDYDYSADNGRIYCYDRFTFDPRGNDLKKFQRDFDYNGQGADKAGWRNWLRKFQDEPLPDNALAVKFAQVVASTYNRPITSSLLERFIQSSGQAFLQVTVPPEVWQLIKPNISFLSEVSTAAAAQGLGLIQADARITVEPAGDELKVTISYPLDNDYVADNGRVFVSDQFTLRASDRSFKGFERIATFKDKNSDHPAPGGEWDTKLKAVQAAKKPSEKQQREFADAVARPAVLPAQAAAVADLEYFRPTRDRLREAGLELKVTDPRAHYTLVDRNHYWEVLFTYPVDDANPATVGHLWMQQVFVFQKNVAPEEPVGFEQRYLAAEGSPAGEGWEALAAKLNETAPTRGTPEAEQLLAGSAGKFISHFVPHILERAPHFQDTFFEPRTPPPGGYVELTDELFDQFRDRMIREDTAASRWDVETNFLRLLPGLEDYYAPLREALGEDFDLYLKSPPLEVDVQFNGEDTAVRMEYTFTGNSLDGTPGGTLTFSETFHFKGRQLASIDRAAELSGEDSDLRLAGLQTRLNDKIASGGFFSPGSEPAEKMRDKIAAYLAPQVISYAANIQPTREDPKLDDASRRMLEILHDIEGSLTSYLYNHDVEMKFRVPLLRALNEIQYGKVDGNFEKAGQTLAALLQVEGSALEEAGAVYGASYGTSDEAKQRAEFHQDRMNIINVVLKISGGKVEEALQDTRKFHSHELQAIFTPQLQRIETKKRVYEGLAVMREVALDLVRLKEHHSKRWLMKGEFAGFDPVREVQTVVALFDKANTHAHTSRASSPFAVLQELTGLSPAQAAVRDKLLHDRSLQEINGVAQDQSVDSAAGAYFQVARGLYRQQLFRSAAWLAHWLASEKMPPSPSLEGLEILKIIAAGRLAQSSDGQATPAQRQMAAAVFIFQQQTGLKAALKQKNGVEPSDAEAEAFQRDIVRDLVLQQQGVKLTDEEIDGLLLQQLQQSLKNNFKIELSPEELNEVKSRKVPELSAALAKKLEEFSKSEEAELFGRRMEDIVDLWGRIETHAAADPGKAPREILQNMQGLSPTEEEVRQELLAGGNPFYQQLFSIGDLPDRQERLKAYADFLGQLGQQLPALAPQVSQLLSRAQQDALPQGRGMEWLAIFSSLYQSLQAQALDASLMQRTLVELQGGQGTALQAEPGEGGGGRSPEQASLDALFDQARSLALASPGASPLEILAKIDDPALRGPRDALLDEDFAKKFSEAAKESDAWKRRQKYLDILKSGDLEKNGLSGVVAQLRPMVSQGRLPRIAPQELQIHQSDLPDQEKAKLIADLPQHRFAGALQEFLALTGGAGDFSTKLQYQLPLYKNELFKPTSLFAMVTGGLAGPGARALALGGIQEAGWAGGTLLAGRFGAGALGAVVGGTTFSTSMKLGESAFYSSEDRSGASLWGWGRCAKDAAFDSLLFGGMHLGHAGVGLFSERVLAAGKMPAWLGGKFWGRYVYDRPGSTMVETPLGDARPMLPVEVGPYVPQLTVAGARLTGALNHGVGVGGLYTMGYAGEALKLRERSPQDWRGHGADAVIMYLQALAGFKIADGGVNGRFQEAITVINSTPQFMGRELTLDPQARVPDGLIELASSPPSPNTPIRPSLDPLAALRARLESLVGPERMRELEVEQGSLHLLDRQGVRVSSERAPKEMLEGLKIRLGEEGVRGLEFQTTAAPEGQSQLQFYDGRTVIIRGAEVFINGQQAVVGKWVPLEAGALLTVGRPTVDPLLRLNGQDMPVGQWVNVEPGSTLAGGGKEFKNPLEFFQEKQGEVAAFETQSGLVSKLAELPREEQLSLAGIIGRAKNPAKLIKKLETRGSEGAALWGQAVTAVFQGKMPLSALPYQLGLRAKVEQLLGQEVSRLQGEGLSVDRFEVNPNPSWTPVEVDYHTGRLAQGLAQRVRAANSLEEVQGAVVQSAMGGLAKVQGFDVVDLATRLAIRSLGNRIEARQKQLAAGEPEPQDLVELRTQLAGIRENYTENPYTLPSGAGIRQRVHDLEEASPAFHGKRPREELLVKLVKRNLKPSASDYAEAQTVLRQEMDGLSPRADIMLRSGHGDTGRHENMDAILQAYFGYRGERELATAEQAYAVAERFAEAGPTDTLSLHAWSGNRGPGHYLELGANLSRRNIPPVLVVHPAEIGSNGAVAKGILFQPGEIEGMTTRLYSYLSQPRLPQDSSLPSLKTPAGADSSQVFTSRVLHPKGGSELTLEMSKNETSGQWELSDARVRYAVKDPNLARGEQWDIALRSIQDLEIGGVKVQVESQPYARFSDRSQLPLDVKPPTLWRDFRVGSASAFPDWARLPDGIRQRLYGDKKDAAGPTLPVTEPTKDGKQKLPPFKLEELVPSSTLWAARGIGKFFTPKPKAVSAPDAAHVAVAGEKAK
jgi:hypothetical protein